MKLEFFVGNTSVLPWHGKGRSIMWLLSVREQHFHTKLSAGGVTGPRIDVDEARLCIGNTGVLQWHEKGRSIMWLLPGREQQLHCGTKWALRHRESSVKLGNCTMGYS